jgi:hypothetical protein
MKEAIISNDKNIGGHGDGHAKFEDHICNSGLSIKPKKSFGHVFEWIWQVVDESGEAISMLESVGLIMIM